MDPQTIDQIIEGVKIVGIAGGGAIVALAAVYGTVAGIMHVAETKYALDKMYEDGRLPNKPTRMDVLRQYNPLRKFSRE